jgi:hypothetical protein
MSELIKIPADNNGFAYSDKGDCNRTGNEMGLYSHISTGQVASALASVVTNQHVTNEANQTRALITSGFNAMNEATARALAVQLQDSKDEVAALKQKAGASPSI